MRRNTLRKLEMMAWMLMSMIITPMMTLEILRKLSRTPIRLKQYPRTIKRERLIGMHKVELPKIDRMPIEMKLIADSHIFNGCMAARAAVLEI